MQFGSKNTLFSKKENHIFIEVLRQFSKNQYFIKKSCYIGLENFNPTTTISNLIT